MEDNRTMVVTLGSLIEEDIITPESLTQRVGIRTGKILLPIYSPEIHTLALMVTNYILKERLGEIGIIQAPIYIVTIVIQVLAT